MNTAHFIIDMNGHVIPLGVGPNTFEGGNNLLNLAKSIAESERKEFPKCISVIYNIADLYKIIEEAKDALNNLDNDALTVGVEDSTPTL